MRTRRHLFHSQRFANSKPPRWYSPPTSPSIEAAAAQQEHDNDDNEKSCHIHAVSPSGRRLLRQGRAHVSACSRLGKRLDQIDSPRDPLGFRGLAAAAFTGKLFTNATASSSHALSLPLIGTGGSI